jgi:hypothetical protein
MSNATSRGTLAVIAGLVCLSIAALVFVVFVFVAMTGGTTSVFDLEPGDCFVLPIDGADTSLYQVEPVACTAPHDAEVVMTGQLDADQERDYPSDDVLFAELDGRCAVVTIPAQFGMLPIAPDEASWQPLGGRFLCLAVPYGGGTVNRPVSAF